MAGGWHIQPRSGGLAELRRNRTHCVGPCRLDAFRSVPHAHGFADGRGTRPCSVDGVPRWRVEGGRSERACVRNNRTCRRRRQAGCRCGVGGGTNSSRPGFYRSIAGLAGRRDRRATRPEPGTRRRQGGQSRGDNHSTPAQRLDRTDRRGDRRGWVRRTARSDLRSPSGHTGPFTDLPFGRAGLVAQTRGHRPSGEPAPLEVAEEAACQVRLSASARVPVRTAAVGVRNWRCCLEQLALRSNAFLTVSQNEPPTSCGRHSGPPATGRSSPAPRFLIRDTRCQGRL